MTSSFPPQTLRLKDYLEIFSTYFKISQEWKILEHFLKNFRQVSLLLLSECERINQLQFSPKSTKDHRFFVFLMISERIKFTSSLNIRSKIGQYSLQIYQQMSILSTEKYQMIKQVFLQTMFRTEAVAQRCSVKKVLLKISQNSQENTCARASFLIKLQASGLQIYLKRDSGTGTFPCVLRNFQEHLFLENVSGGCCC